MRQAYDYWQDQPGYYSIANLLPGATKISQGENAGCIEQFSKCVHCVILISGKCTSNQKCTHHKSGNLHCWHICLCASQTKHQQPVLNLGATKCAHTRARTHTHVANALPFESIASHNNTTDTQIRQLLQAPHTHALLLTIRRNVNARMR